MRVFVNTLLLFVTCTVFIGCASSQRAFNEARAVNTSSAYTEFIEKYPDSELAEEAKQLKIQALEREEKEALEWCERQLSSAPSEAYRCLKNLLAVYPDNQIAQQILETKFIEMLIIGKLSIPEDILNILPKSSQYSDTVKIMVNITIHDPRSLIRETYQISSQTIASLAGRYVNFPNDETIDGKQTVLIFSPSEREKFFFWQDALFIKEGVESLSQPDIADIYHFHSVSFGQINIQVFSDRTRNSYMVDKITPGKVSFTTQQTLNFKSGRVIQPIKLFFHPFILNHGELGKLKLFIGEFAQQEYEQFVSTLLKLSQQ